MKVSFSFLCKLLPKALLSATIVLVTAYGTLAQRTKPVPNGEWGGTGIVVSVTDDGAKIQFDCADGTITRQLRMKKDGSFTAEGNIMRNGPGPIRADDQGIPVKFSGKVIGKRMMLHVVDAKTGASVGDHTVIQNGPASLHRCY